MKVLVAHNRYSSRAPSGENLAVEDEVAWLRGHGVEVILVSPTNDSALTAGALEQVGHGARAIWSNRTARHLDGLISELRPDVVHLQNPFPSLSAAAIAGARRAGAPVVWTAHNRRLTCVAGSHYRDGAPCYQCQPGWRLPGVIHGCYAESPAASAAVTIGTSLYRTMARRHVVAIANSEFTLRWLVDVAGFHPDRAFVKRNGIAIGQHGAIGAGSADNALFIGRLTAYKGITLLLDAWRSVAGVRSCLRIAGGGDLVDVVLAAASADPRIQYLGELSRSETARELAECRVVVVPSLTEETFGRVVAEAHGHGRPVITTGRGALSELVDSRSGWLVDETPDALARTLVKALSRDSETDREVDRRGREGRRRYLDELSPEATTSRLLDIYRHAIALHEHS